MKQIDCAFVLPGARCQTVRNRRIVVNGDRIAVIDDCEAREARPILALPALVNAHDHARAVRSSSFGAAGKPLEIWLSWMAMLPPVDPWLATAVSLARSALGGAGIVMIHYTRVQGITDFVTEAREVARAARDVGVRVGFAVAMRDINPLVYGPSEPILAALPSAARAEVERRLMPRPLPVHELIERVDAVAIACSDRDFNVQYGPAGVQWCSDELLAAVADASARTGRRVHMHLLETRNQREWADRTYPQGIVAYLDDIGLLSPRLTLAHCTWARADELERLASRGVTIAVNASSNLAIRSGIAPVAAMVRAGCRVACGLDGLALDEDDDALRELRLNALLHQGIGFAIDVDRATMLAMAFVNGRRAVLGSDVGGELAAGAPADVLMLDWGRVDDDRLVPALDPCDLLFARANARHIDELIVAGRSIARNGTVSGIDLPVLKSELVARLRASIASDSRFEETLRVLDHRMAMHYDPQHASCW
ncbi:MAG TPA: amidohydrolase family protein [Casimicrobiaceae bacterium]|nr:amidohydrolase family protein [Casimicrobiaceae bacterium]